MINEGSQLRHHLMAAGIVEKHTRRHWREWLQYPHKFPRPHEGGGDRLRHLCKTHTFCSCAISGRTEGRGLVALSDASPQNAVARVAPEPRATPKDRASIHERPKTIESRGEAAIGRATSSSANAHGLCASGAATAANPSGVTWWAGR